MSEEALPQLIFVCGTPRSGVDLMLDFLSAPKVAGWLPEKLAAQPDKLAYARRIHQQSLPFLGEFYLERRYMWKRVPTPDVADEFLNHYLSNFDLADRDFVVPGPEHVSEEEREALRNAVQEISNLQRRNNLVLGYTGFPRVRMLRSIFPNAKFIQCIRDPRSVAFQMIRKQEKIDHAFFKQREKVRDHMPEVLQERLKTLEDSPLVFCGAFVRWLHHAYQEELSEIPESDRLEVAYSDILSRPAFACKKSLKFCGYPNDKRFKYYLKFHDIQVSNQRSSRNLNDEEAELLAQAIAPID